MVSLILSDFGLGVLVGILVSELVAIVWLTWVMLRDLKRLEETLEQIGDGSPEEVR